ncbi:hypothetical protein E2320_013427 [Naja naja]|nr:hypothetical protein E2320_013427 [Naja naja]
MQPQYKHTEKNSANTDCPVECWWQTAGSLLCSQTVVASSGGLSPGGSGCRGRCGSCATGSGLGAEQQAGAAVSEKRATLGGSSWQNLAS